MTVINIINFGQQCHAESKPKLWIVGSVVSPQNILELALWSSHEIHIFVTPSAGPQDHAGLLVALFFGLLFSLILSGGDHGDHVATKRFYLYFESLSWMMLIPMSGEMTFAPTLMLLCCYAFVDVFQGGVATFATLVFSGAQTCFAVKSCKIPH